MVVHSKIEPWILIVFSTQLPSFSKILQIGLGHQNALWNETSVQKCVIHEQNYNNRKLFDKMLVHTNILQSSANSFCPLTNLEPLRKTKISDMQMTCIKHCSCAMSITVNILGASEHWYILPQTKTILSDKLLTLGVISSNEEWLSMYHHFSFTWSHPFHDIGN